MPAISRPNRQLNMGLVEHQFKQGCVPKQQLTARGALHARHLLWMLFYRPLARKGPWNRLISPLWLVRTHASCSSSSRMRYMGAETELSLCPLCTKRLPATCVQWSLVRERERKKRICLASHETLKWVQQSVLWETRRLNSEGGSLKKIQET